MTGGEQNPTILDVECLVEPSLHDVISFVSCDSGGKERSEININFQTFESRLAPIYYLNFERAISTILHRNGLSAEEVAAVVYSNLSNSDKEGFAAALGFAPTLVHCPKLAAFGHVFGSDVVINYTELRNGGCLQRGDQVLLVSAGVGFAWGVTLVRI